MADGSQGQWKLSRVEAPLPGLLDLDLCTASAPPQPGLLPFTSADPGFDRTFRHRYAGPAISASLSADRELCASLTRLTAALPLRLVTVRIGPDTVRATLRPWAWVLPSTLRAPLERRLRFAVADLAGVLAAISHESGAEAEVARVLLDASNDAWTAGNRAEREVVQRRLVDALDRLGSRRGS